MRAALATLVAVTLAAVASVAGPLAFQASQHAVPAAVEGPQGDLFYRRGTMALRLTEGRCDFPKMAEPLEEEGIPPALAYVMIQEGRPQVRGCWVRTFSDEVLLLDMSGGESFMPRSWFKREPGV